MNKTAAVFGYISRHISVIVVSVSLLSLAISAYIVLQPHVGHKMFSFLNTNSNREDSSFYDSGSDPTTTPRPTTEPSPTGCLCPVCCSVQ